MSRTRTTTQTLQPTSTYTLPLTGAATPPRVPSPSDQLIQPPLTETPTGSLLTNVPRTQLTPAIGIQFDKQFQFKTLLDMHDGKDRKELLNDLAYNISLHGVAIFESQSSLTPSDLGRLALLLGEAGGKPSDSTLHVHPTQELGENGELPVGKISNVAEEGGRQISFPDERSILASQGWHTDVSFEPRPAMYSLLKMHTLPPTGGDTLFMSSYKIYDLLSPGMKAFLSTLTATHDAEMFRLQSLRHGFPLYTLPRGAPDNQGDAFRATHPVVRTNPTTGLRGVFVNATFTTRINELNLDESEALLAYLYKLQHQSHDAQVRFRWNTNDLAIWDNRSTLHVATFDYDELRAGDRTVVCGEVPYLDPVSLGRKEWEEIRRKEMKA
ncbi:taurine catabolism dioxygenase [Meredithblackwellia eburnea MCA 4105]